MTSEKKERSNTRNASKEEWVAWQLVCDALLKAGAITEEDRNSPVNAKETEGQKIFHLIREWGDFHANLTDGVLTKQGGSLSERQCDAMQRRFTPAEISLINGGEMVAATKAVKEREQCSLGDALQATTYLRNLIKGKR